MLNSRGKTREDTSVYIGVGGHLYMYYRLILFAKRTNQVDLANMFIMKAHQLIESAEEKINEQE